MEHLPSSTTPLVVPEGALTVLEVHGFHMKWTTEKLLSPDDRITR
jgi:hypothetical protein